MNLISVLDCQFSRWYPYFHKHTFEACFFPLPDGFVSYLREEGVYLPGKTSALPKRDRRKDRPYLDLDDRYDLPNESSDDSDSNGESDDDDASAEDWTQTFPELFKSLSSAVEDLGGEVVPKLNWSCPSDATWVNPRSSISCGNAEEVVLMLKCSERVSSDLALLEQIQKLPSTATVVDAEPVATAGIPAPKTPTPVLVLRRWYDLSPDREFRCFVRGGRLVACSQRDAGQCFPQLVGATGREALDRIRRRIWTFHKEVVRRATCPASAAGAGVADFGRLLRLGTYTYDVYVPHNAKAKVRLIDFNACVDTTSSLLLGWHELGLVVLPTAEESAASAAAEDVMRSGRRHPKKRRHDEAGDPSSSTFLGDASSSSEESSGSENEEECESDSGITEVKYEDDGGFGEDLKKLKENAKKDVSAGQENGTGENDVPGIGSSAGQESNEEDQGMFFNEARIGFSGLGSSSEDVGGSGKAAGDGGGAVDLTDALVSMYPVPTCAADLEIRVVASEDLMQGGGVFLPGGMQMGSKAATGLPYDVLYFQEDEQNSSSMGSGDAGQHPAGGPRGDDLRDVQEQFVAAAAGSGGGGANMGSLIERLQREVLRQQEEELSSGVDSGDDEQGSDESDDDVAAQWLRDRPAGP